VEEKGKLDGGIFGSRGDGARTQSIEGRQEGRCSESIRDRWKYCGKDHFNATWGGGSKEKKHGVGNKEKSIKEPD